MQAETEDAREKEIILPDRSDVTGSGDSSDEAVEP